VSLHVLYFASLRDLTGVSQEEVEVSEGWTAADLWESLGRRHPRLAAFTVRPLVACDKAYATWETPLDGVREVAFLPPVSGG
jgi:sulfur-carrier protein